MDPQTGYVFDLGILSGIIETNVLNYFDHKNLNLDVPEFAALNPTAENIVVLIYEILEKAINKPGLELKVRLYETERNYAEYPA